MNIIGKKGACGRKSQGIFNFTLESDLVSLAINFSAYTCHRSRTPL